MPEHQQTQQSTESKSTVQKQATPRIQTPVSHPMAIIQRARINPKSLTHADVMQLQKTIGNRAVVRLLSEVGLIPSKAKQASPVQRQELVQRQEIPEEEPLQGKFESIQRQEISEEEKTCTSCVQRQETLEEEEKPLQGKFESKLEQIACSSCIQKKELEEEEPLQTKRENNTGMPDNLKTGVESLSGIDMSDVRVHYNSSKPADVGALAYTQGTEIHVASGQERHLPHEAWHVVQQKQGRVRPTMQLKDVSVNDDVELEHEADVMGERTAKNTADPELSGQTNRITFSSMQTRSLGFRSIPSVIQGMFWEKTPDGKYIWHYGPVIKWFWKASSEEPRSDKPGEKKYGVWIRRSTLTGTPPVPTEPPQAAAAAAAPEVEQAPAAKARIRTARLARARDIRAAASTASTQPTGASTASTASTAPPQAAAAAVDEFEREIRNIARDSKKSTSKEVMAEIKEKLEEKFRDEGKTYDKHKKRIHIIVETYLKAQLQQAAPVAAAAAAPNPAPAPQTPAPKPWDLEQWGPRVDTTFLWEQVDEAVRKKVNSVAQGDDPAKNSARWTIEGTPQCLHWAVSDSIRIFMAREGDKYHFVAYGDHHGSNSFDVFTVGHPDKKSRLNP